MTDLPTLATARLTLRQRVPDDAGALFATMADADAMRWWSCAPFDSVDALRAWFAGGPCAWAVTRTGEDRAIGFVSVGWRRAGVGEIGYLFARETWGCGIAREAVSAVIAHLFADGARRLFADSDPDNAGSIRLLRRLGFTLEGRLRGEWETHIGVRDSLIFGLLRDEWRP
ncbi:MULTISPECIES: GNAT family protein [unclassified Sphingomonas]|uniref:GNAT family N-acetyltransferase n=1 Tax=unclassified Sphingomonas TaxID=196159 RepID=UPI0025D75683|nr:MULTISPECIES: GNAT family protein [unclassified Sphingomonas]